MIFYENRLPADDSNAKSCLFFFGKSDKILNCRLLQTIGGALRMKHTDIFTCYFTQVDTSHAHTVNQIMQHT